MLVIAFLLSLAGAPSQGPSPGDRVRERHPPQSQSKQEQGPATPDGRGPEAAPLVVRVVNAPDSERAANERPQERQEKATADWWLVRFTAGLFVVAVFQVGLFWWQLRLIRLSLTDTKKSADAAKKSADATEATVATMKDTAERQLRPYVFIQETGIGNVALAVLLPGAVPTEAQLNRPWEGPTAAFVIKNTGQTPAFDVINWANIHVAEFPLRTELPGQTVGLYVTRGALGPGGTSTKRLTWSPPLTALELADLRAGKIAIYVYGYISYRDQFGKHRTTNFRFMHGYMSGPLGISTDLTICDEGNDAD